LIIIKKVFITGRPGIGKTTLFLKVIHSLRREGLTVGGFICPEVRVGGRRVGFKIIDLASGNEGFLAKICDSELSLMKEIPKVGKYCVNVSDAVNIGVNAINNALQSSDIVGIDEIGPMELSVEALKKAVFKALTSPKPLVAVVHRTRTNEILRKVPNALLYTVTLRNRDSLLYDVLDALGH